MKISDLLSMCFRNLFRRKVRTILTVVGVVIGTCSIIIMISLGVGLNKEQEDAISEMMDVTTIEVYAKGGSGGGGMMIGMGGATAEASASGGSGKTAVLDDQLVRALDAIPQVEGVTPMMELYGEGIIKTGNYQYNGSIIGIDLAQMERLGYELTSGQYAASGDDLYTMIVGEEAAYQFVDIKGRDGGYIPMYDAMGNQLPPPFEMMEAKFTIGTPQAGKEGAEDGMGMGEQQIAITTKEDHKIYAKAVLKGDCSKDNGSSYYGIYVDMKLAQKLHQQYLRENNQQQTTKGYTKLKVKVTDIKYVKDIEDYIKELGFDTYSFEMYREQLEQQAKLTQMILGALGFISLLVAAIGIANTMIMSIYERTREIGIMKVLGCDTSSIRTMFLCEAGGIGLLGGIVGILLSMLISMAVNAVVSSVSGMQMSLSVIPFWLVLLGLGFSVGVGLVAGFYPANRAVRISALKAIKQE